MFNRTTITQGLLFVPLFLTFAYFFHKEAGWNVNSRICLTYAMVEKGSFVIDDYQAIPALETKDIAFYNGHYYSDKIIGTSLLGAIPMAALHYYSRATGRTFSWNAKRYVVTTFSVGVASALAGAALYRLLLYFGASLGGAFFLACAFVFGTQVFSVGTVFLSYGPALLFEILAYGLLVRNREALDARKLFLAGLALGAGLLCEYTLGLVAIGLSIYAYAYLRRKPLIVVFWLGACVPLSLFLAYTITCFGRPVIPYEYLVRAEFKQGMSQGFQGIVGFDPAVLYYITVHRYRGLFYHSPFLVLAVWGWALMWRNRERRSDGLLSISMTAAYLVFNASYYMWWGGWTNGPRHLIPALPFLVLPLAAVWGAGKIGRALLVVLTAVSVFFNTLPAFVDAQLPQGYQAVELYRPRIQYNYRDPLWEMGIKRLWRGQIAVNAGQFLGLRGLWSLAPLVMLWVATAALAWRLVAAKKNGAGT
ncbi:MAG: hypothetical protein N3D11_08620 [Candidatus Sumerlaeia bacterium]|nr:hypothetical protein [Candidatus Sumerlaeia bacterium]